MKTGHFFEENPAVAKMIFEKSLNAARAREAARKARELTRRKSVLEGSQLPANWRTVPTATTPIRKFTSWREIPQAAPPNRDGTGGSRRFLPLWGKMLNVEKARIDKVYGNDKLMPVITALGCGTARILT